MKNPQRCFDRQAAGPQKHEAPSICPVPQWLIRLSWM